MNIEELERLYRARAVTLIEDVEWERILTRLKAAEEWYEAREAMKESRNDFDYQMRRARLVRAEAALIAAHEEEGNG